MLGHPQAQSLGMWDIQFPILGHPQASSQAWECVWDMGGKGLFGLAAAQSTTLLN